jgi:hypothetical protein
MSESYVAPSSPCGHEQRTESQFVKVSQGEQRVAERPEVCRHLLKWLTLHSHAEVQTCSVRADPIPSKQVILRAAMRFVTQHLLFSNKRIRLPRDTGRA